MTLSDDAGNGLRHALCIVNAKGFALVVAEVELGEITLQVLPGTIEYDDAAGRTYRTSACALLMQGSGKFNACPYGNTANQPSCTTTACNAGA